MKNLLERLDPKYVITLEVAKQDYEYSVDAIFKVLKEKKSSLDLTISELHLLILHTGYKGDVSMSAIFKLFPPTT
tara:strand:- start:1174 stop:1398 length:225 start_codon:yes stop_codon:yes gene_type:complete